MLRERLSSAKQSQRYRDWPKKTGASVLVTYRQPITTRLSPVDGLRVFLARSGPTYKEQVHVPQFLLFLFHMGSRPCLIWVLAKQGMTATRFTELPSFWHYEHPTSRLHLDEKGRITGYKTILQALNLDIGRLDSSSMGSTPYKERSLEAIRWLAAGVSQDEQDHLKLPVLPCSAEDTQHARERFGLPKQAFKTFGLRKSCQPCALPRLPFSTSPLTCEG